MGFSFEAFTAGTRPNTTPMTMEKATAMMQAGTLMATGVPMMWDIISARPIDRKSTRLNSSHVR